MSLTPERIEELQRHCELSSSVWLPGCQPGLITVTLLRAELLSLLDSARALARLEVWLLENRNALIERYGAGVFAVEIHGGRGEAGAVCQALNAALDAVEEEA